MRLEITERTLYTYGELSDKAKEAAREWYARGACEDSFWTESIFESAADAAALFGLDIRQTRKALLGGGHRYGPAVYWSGFWSQGDGACCEGTWYARDVKPGALAKEFPRDEELQRIAAVFESVAKAYPDASFSVKHRGHYYHSGCTAFEFEPGDCPHDEEENEEENGRASDWYRDFPEDDLKQAARDFMDWIYSGLEKEYEYQTSEEACAEACEANGYEFTEAGEIA